MTTAQYQVPLHKHGAIVGPGGSTIRSIQEQYSVSIIMPSRESQSACVSISGTHADVQQAKETIEKIIHFRLSNEPLVKDVLVIPAEKHSILIGTKGANKEKIERTCNVFLTLPQRGSGNDVTVLGTKESIIHAKNEMSALLNLEIIVKGEETVKSGCLYTRRPLKGVKDVLFFGTSEESNPSYKRFLEYLFSATTTLDICVFTISEDEISRIIMAHHKRF
eukprot:TRINITY_DN1902_c0_g2_i10.p1 TRINITY_DN1902_c0_g2~~TRINITY_DN1902_c0_g2_i10.p1  ORF type:complete len:221 (-),score=29.03 TRINITY_DN1902_c0_g2_i10:567-1229(-)